MSKFNLSVVLPCYNESANLPALFNRLDRIAEKRDDVQIVLVNNGSTDHSEAVFNELLSLRGEQFKLVNVNINRGYGYGIMAGLKSCDAPILSWTHADIQTDPIDVLYALEVFNSEYFTMVKGSRRNRNYSEAFFSWGMGLFASFVLRTRLTEINAQPKLFSRDFFDQIKDDAPDDFSLDLYFLFKAKKLGKVIDIPVYFSKRMAGEAKGGSGSSWKQKVKLMKRTFIYIMALKKKL
jgi:glycosyltransferase involved in cell wall biosynthesis